MNCSERTYEVLKILLTRFHEIECDKAPDEVLFCNCRKSGYEVDIAPKGTKNLSKGVYFYEHADTLLEQEIADVGLEYDEEFELESIVEEQREAGENPSEDSNNECCSLSSGETGLEPSAPLEDDVNGSEIIIGDEIRKEQENISAARS